MPLILLIVGVLVSIFSVTSFVTFKEVRTRKNSKKKPQFLKQWHKIRDKLER